MRVGMHEMHALRAWRFFHDNDCPYSPSRISGGNSKLCTHRTSSMVRKCLLTGNFRSPIT